MLQKFCQSRKLLVVQAQHRSHERILFNGEAYCVIVSF
jgi:hypothetical protein